MKDEGGKLSKAASIMQMDIRADLKGISLF